MKFIPITILLFIGAQSAQAQTLDSIFFNLYTDSLKKGTYNYKNVEGHFTDGTYLPLGEKEIKFSSSGGRFNGNSLFIDSSLADDKVTIKAVLIRNPRLTREISIYIKKSPDDEKLPTLDEVIKGKKTTTDSIPKKRRSRSKSA